MHPKLEELTLNLVEPDHALLKAFQGKGRVFYCSPSASENQQIPRADLRVKCRGRFMNPFT